MPDDSIRMASGSLASVGYDAIMSVDQLITFQQNELGESNPSQVPNHHDDRLDEDRELVVPRTFLSEQGQYKTESFRYLPHHNDKVYSNSMMLV